MAQAMASMAGLRGSSQAVLEGSLQLSGCIQFNVSGGRRVDLSKTGFVVRTRVSAEAEMGRRAVLGLVTAGIASGSFVKAVMAAANPIKSRMIRLECWLLAAGTLNSDQQRDLDLPLKSRFYLQPPGPSEATQRVKESAKDIINVKPLIYKKAWPYVLNYLRLKAEFLRYDLNTVMSAKPKNEKKSLKELPGKLFETISNLDHTVKIKSTPEAEKCYTETVSALNNVLA